MPSSGPITVFGNVFGNWNHGAQVLAGASWVAAGLMLAVGAWVLLSTWRNSWLGSAPFRRWYNGPRNRCRLLLEPVARRLARAGQRASQRQADKDRAAVERAEQDQTSPVPPVGALRRWRRRAGTAVRNWLIRRIDHILRPGLWRFLKDASTDTLDRELRLDEGQSREVRLARWQRLGRRPGPAVRAAVGRCRPDGRAGAGGPLRRGHPGAVPAHRAVGDPRAAAHRAPAPHLPLPATQAGLPVPGPATCCPSAVSWPSWTRVAACESCPTRTSSAACSSSASSRVRRRWSSAGCSSRRPATTRRTCWPGWRRWGWAPAWYRRSRRGYWSWPGRWAGRYRRTGGRRQLRARDPTRPLAHRAVIHNRPGRVGYSGPVTGRDHTFRPDR